MVRSRASGRSKREDQKVVAAPQEARVTVWYPLGGSDLQEVEAGGDTSRRIGGIREIADVLRAEIESGDADFVRRPERVLPRIEGRRGDAYVFPLLETLLHALRSWKRRPVKFCFFVTKQVQPHENDTAPLAGLVEQAIRIAFSGATVERLLISGNPCDYMAMREHFAHRFARVMLGDEDLFVIGPGTPQMSMGIVLALKDRAPDVACFQIMRHAGLKRVPLASSWAWREFRSLLEAALQRRDFSAARAVLKSSHLRIVGLSDLLRSLDERRCFDFRRALGSFESFEARAPRSTEIGRFHGSLSNLVKADRHARLAEYLAAIDASSASGRYPEVLAYACSLLEAWAKFLFVQTTGLDPEDPEVVHRYATEVGGDSMDRRRGAAAYLKEGDILHWISVMRSQGRIREDHRRAWDVFHDARRRLGSSGAGDLFHLRNQGPLAHGALGVGCEQVLQALRPVEKVAAVAGMPGIQGLQDVPRILAGLLEASTGLTWHNPWDDAERIIDQVLRREEQRRTAVLDGAGTAKKERRS